MRKTIYGLLMMLLCAALLAGCAKEETGSGAALSDLVIDIASLTGDVSFIDYDASGTAMQVLAQVDASGTPELSYNTCQSCQGSPFAYFEVQNDLLVCRNCGNLFSYDSIGEKQAYGCMPIALDGYTVEDGKIIIPGDILGGMKDTFVNWKKGL